MKHKVPDTLVCIAPGIWRLFGTEHRFYARRTPRGRRWLAPHDEKTYRTLMSAAKAFVKHMKGR